MRLVVRRKSVAFIVVVAVCGTTALATYALLPKLAYLPEGNRNLVFGVVLPPPGYNLETTTGIAIPCMLSVLAYGDPNAVVAGLDSFDDPTPPINLVFQAYHLMLLIATVLVPIALLAAGLFLWTPRR